MRYRLLAALVITAAVGVASNAHAQDRPTFRVSHAAQPPKIDGVLDDEAWQQAPLTFGDWRSYNPLRGDMLPPNFRTDVRIAYDDRNLYLAFHCVDPEPDKIRTTISRRDNAFNDDWIAMSLDSAATGQSAYHLFINPSGMQMDALNTSASGEQFDVDMVWYSMGRVTEDGYTVEVRLPLQTLRFSGGDEVSMGILFFRKISRMGVSYSWPDMPSGQWVFDRHARMQFNQLTQPRLVELLPSATYGVNQTRATTNLWNRAANTTNLGLSGKFGVTSNITLDGTVNPDFSQVESDAFQVQVNQRFPLFFSEKRPFFMEGMGLFNVAGTGGDSNMRTAVHTRRIVDPLWGTKLTGTHGQTTFGLLSALDEGALSAPLSGGVSSAASRLFTVARATYALGGANYLGAILTDTERDGRYNRVVGGDVSIKPSPAQQVSATWLESRTGGTVDGDTQGTGAQGSYSINTRRFTWSNQVEHYDRAFQMDTAFINRTGFTSAWSFGQVNFYPGGGKAYWLQRVYPFYFAKRGHDDVQDGSEGLLNTGVRFNVTRQGFLEISRSAGHETWRGERFEIGRSLNVRGNAQVFRWLRVSANVNRGPATYYDPIDPFQGRSHGGSFGVTLQPNQHLSQNVDVNTTRFDRASTGERIFSVRIVNLRTTYQFNRRFLVRLLEQFDSSSRRLLTDLLASYELVPGTVFHAGYGSLVERRTGDTDLERPFSTPPSPGYQTVSRGLFFKASYLHRF